MQSKKKITLNTAFLLVLMLLTHSVSAQEADYQQPSISSEKGGMPTCRIHFTKSWEDYAADFGEMPTSEFSRQLTSAFKSAGVHLAPEPFVPWSRATEQVMRGNGHGLSVALETPERAEVLEFLGPIFRSKWYAYQKSGEPQVDTTNPKVGVFNTYADLAPVQQAVKDINGQIIGMPLERLGRMLETGYIDMIYGPVIGVGYLQDKMKQELERVPGIEFEMLSYVAIRKDAPCMHKKDALNVALAEWSQSDIALAYSTASPLAKNFADIMKSARGRAK